MPIHLPPLSRRQFIHRGLAAGAGLFLGQSLFSQDKAVDANSWALLADTHVDADPDRVVRDAHLARNLANVAKELVGLPRTPAGVLINGDCAYLDGQKGDYATLARLLEPIREAEIPVHLTLGNHDNRDHFWDGIVEAKAAERPVADKHVAILRSPHANWFLLDSLEHVNVTPGLLGEEQLAWLAQTLDANADKPAIIVTHHNLQRGEVTHALKDSLPLLEVIEPRRQVKAYIFGHTHNWNVTREESGIHMINLPPVAYVFNQANPSGWVHANLRADGMQLEMRSLDPSHEAHAEVMDLEWRT